MKFLSGQYCRIFFYLAVFLISIVVSVRIQAFKIVQYPGIFQSSNLNQTKFFLVGDSSIIEHPDFAAIFSQEDDSIVIFKAGNKYNETSQARTDWDVDSIDQSDAIIFWFPDSTENKEAGFSRFLLMKLLDVIQKNKNIIVGVHPNSELKDELVNELKISRPTQQLFNSLNELALEIQNFHKSLLETKSDKAQIIAAVHFFSEVIPTDFKKLSSDLSGNRVYNFQLASENHIARFIPKTVSPSVKLEFHHATVTSEIGISPKVYYSSENEQEGTIIMEFVEKQQVPLNDKQFLKALAISVKKLHGCKNFDSLERTIIDYIDQLRDKYKLPFIADEDESKFNQNFECLKKVWAKFSRNKCTVHHDISPFNVLYSNKIAYLIDWEEAALDVFHVDLATITNFFAVEDDDREFFLKEYFSGSISPDDLHKLNFIKPFTFILYGLWFTEKITDLGLINEGRKITDILPQNKLTYQEFHRLFNRGEISLDSSESIVSLILAMTNEAIRLMDSDLFAMAKQYLAE